MTKPKTKGSRRSVRLTSQAVALPGALWSVYRADADIVFPAGPGRSDIRRLPARQQRPQARPNPGDRERGHPAQRRALGLPTSKDGGFPSRRHTYARIVLENGGELSWLARQLAHSSEAVTHATSTATGRSTRRSGRSRSSRRRAPSTSRRGPRGERVHPGRLFNANLLLGVGSLVAGTLLVVFAWDAQAKRNSGSSS
jgi:integrase